MTQQMMAQFPAEQKELLNSIMSFSSTSSVTGREDEASKYVLKLFKTGICTKDKLGNLVITIGSGYPKRLFVAPLDEPGYVISQIQEDGYLRLTPVGFGQLGAMYHQFLEGNEIKINTATKVQLGISTVPSSHYDGLRAIPEKSKSIFQWQESFIDIGVSSSKEVAAKGIQLLDPVTLNKKPMIIADKYIAAPSVASKAAVIALATVANTLMQQSFSGTVVIAFSTLELINGKGIETIANKYGPFDQVVRFNRFLQSTKGIGDGVLVDKTIPNISGLQNISTPVIPFRHPSTFKPNWGTAAVYGVGLPTQYPATPVEMVNVKNVENLIQVWLQIIENKTWNVVALQDQKPEEKPEVYNEFNREEKILSALIAQYGVYPEEKPVRDYILSQLPKWAKPVMDEKGNIVLQFGKGKEHYAFVAHMDEVGFTVDTIRNDGSLQLKETGGFFNWVWEGHTAIVHTQTKEIPAIFQPRDNYIQATKRLNAGNPIVANCGFHSKAEAIEAGIKEGTTSVTMPKKMIRLSKSKAIARGFDDRVGCAALLLALENIQPDKLPFTITFVWSVGEEAGLIGSTFAEKSLQDVSIGFPIDTYVSSDAPMESKQFGYCPLGNGAVIRVLESVNFIGRNQLKNLQTLAKQNNIKVQYGMTAGGTDGQGFLSYGIPSVPLSWPGRYSHSPVEVMDFNDMSSLVKLIKALIGTGKIQNIVEFFK